MWYRDGAQVEAQGFFGGYNNWVWAVILLQAAGGLVSLFIPLFSCFYLTYNDDSQLFIACGDGGEVRRQCTEGIRDVRVHLVVSGRVRHVLP